MKRVISFIGVFIIVLSCIIPLTLVVSADAEVKKDGLNAVVKTDKDDYEIGEEISVNIDIRNSTGKEIKNVKVDIFLPEGMDAVRGEKLVFNDFLQTSETKTFSTVAVAASKVKEADVDRSDETTDSGIIHKIGISVMVIMGVGGIVCLILAIKHPKKTTKIISVVLCSVLILGIIPVGIFSFVDKDIVFYVDSEIEVDGKEVSVVARVEKLNKKHTQYLDIELGKVMYDTFEDMYYVFDKLGDLEGKLLNTKYAEKVRCKVTDSNGKVLYEKEFSPSEEWTLDDFGLIVGVNKVEFTVTQRDGYEYKRTYKINNLCEENMDNLSVDRKDNDDDGVLNFIEELYDSNPDKTDTDGDGLSDYVEMALIGTAADEKDTDSDGVSDADEDTDGDGISNSSEVDDYLTNPAMTDSDLDGLDDKTEVKDTKTDPNKRDTDDDGKSDSWELEKGFDPGVKDEAFPKSEGVSEVEEITVESDGGATVTAIDNDLNFSQDVPGYIGVDPFHVEVEEESEATIYINYDPEKLEEDEKPTCYKFDENTQDYTEVPSEIVSDGVIKFDTNETASYVLLNHRYLTDVWNNDIFRPSQNEEGAIDIVFVLDRSYSMYSNDPNELRKVVTKTFIDKLRKDKDRAAIVQFTAIAETIMKLTNDKTELKTAVDAIQNSDGGGCGGSDANAGTNGSAGLRAAINELDGSKAEYKYIIFLTDGEDTTSSEEYGDASGESGLIGEAKSKGIVIHTVGLIGSGGVNVELLKTIAAGTGGNYYVATVEADAEVNDELIEIYEDIESITVDRLVDSNKDGISDYYTKLICEGKISTSTGINFLFGDLTFDDVQKNKDADGDGLLNGEEIQVMENEKGVYLKLNSYPYKADSDEDGIRDKDEQISKTSPMKYNSTAEVADVDWIINDENFVSDVYLDLYNENWFERGSVYIGNAFFGTSIDQDVIFRDVLFDYFTSIDKNITELHKNEAYKEMVKEYICGSLDVLEEVVIQEVKKNGLEKAIEVIQDFTGKMGDVLTIGDSFIMDKLVGTPLDEVLINALTKSDQNDLKLFSEHIAECKSRFSYVPDIVPDGTREAYTNVMNSWSKEIAEFSTKYDIKLADINKKTAAVKKVSKFMDYAPLVINFAAESIDAYMDYCDAVASLETIQDNIYILDNIIATTNNVWLHSAASSIKNIVQRPFEEQKNALVDMNTYELTVSTAMDVLHTVIGKAGVPGLLIEVVRSVGNLAFNMDEEAKYAAMVVSLSQTASSLSENYRDHLEGGYAFKNDEIWIAYSSYSKDFYRSLLNLVLLRDMAEERMAEWQGDGQAKENAKKNREVCNSLYNKYSLEYQMYLQMSA